MTIGLVLLVLLAIVVVIRTRAGRAGKDLVINTNEDAANINQVEAESVAISVYNSLVGMGTGSTGFQSAMNSLLALNNNGLRLVHNAYKNKYHRTDYPTFRTLIEGEYVFNWTSQDLMQQVLNKLRGINA